MSYTGQEQSFTRSIGGVAYRVTVKPLNDGSWLTSCERYACGSYHDMPAYQHNAMSEGGAHAQISVIWGVLEVADAMAKEVAHA